MAAELRKREIGALGNEADAVLHDLDGSTLRELLCVCLAPALGTLLAGNANLGLIRGVHADVASTVADGDAGIGRHWFRRNFQVELESVAHPTGPVVNLQMLRSE